MVVRKSTAIDPMYSDGPKKHCNMQHIAAVFAPIAIARFFAVTRSTRRQPRIPILVISSVKAVSNAIAMDTGVLNATLKQM